MKKIYSILMLTMALFSLTGCEKELMDYEGKDCLYFDVRRGASWIEPDLWAHWNYSEVTFGNILSNDTTIAASLGIAFVYSLLSEHEARNAIITSRANPQIVFLIRLFLV